VLVCIKYTKYFALTQPHYIFSIIMQQGLRDLNYHQSATALKIQPNIVPATTPATTSPSEP
jgi:hypothetical protein